MSANMLPTRDPRTGRTDGALHAMDASEVQAISARLRQGQAAWQASGVQARADALMALADALQAHRQALIDVLLADTGRVHESVIEVDATIGAIRRWCGQAPDLLAKAAPKAASVPFIQVQQLTQPYPLVGIISPWNFPLLLSLIDATPALLAGCAVLIKPSEVTSRFVAVVQECVAGLDEALGFATGAAATGKAVVDTVDLLCFTGSVATGRRVAVQAAQNFIPAHLELGGKDAALVFESADLSRAARAVCWGSMVNAGQSCMSLERCYVQTSVLEAFVQALTREVADLRFCWPDAQQGQIGPIISEAQAGVIQHHFDDAFAKGAKALTGGRLQSLGGGLWCEPTVLIDTTPDMLIVAEETFAPVLPLMPFSTESEAIVQANDTKFGLSAAVFTGDPVQATRVASQLQAGAISINDASLTALVHDGAKQSFKLSGLGGSRMGSASLQRFYRQQVLLQNLGVDSPWWFAAAR